jgi:hypothetical protein
MKINIETLKQTEELLLRWLDRGSPSYNLVNSPIYSRQKKEDEKRKKRAEKKANAKPQAEN